MVSLVINGARSGKSRYAQSLAATAEHPIYIATARAEDAEMAARIAQHRHDRSVHWVTAEEPLDLSGAIERHGAQSDFLLVDCLTIWLSNFCWEHRARPPADIEQAALQESGPPPPVRSFFSDIGQRSHAFFVQDQLRLADGRVLITAGYRAQIFSLDQPRFEPAGAYYGCAFAPPPGGSDRRLVGGVSAAADRHENPHARGTRLPGAVAVRAFRHVLQWDELHALW